MCLRVEHKSANLCKQSLASAARDSRTSLTHAVTQSVELMAESETGVSLFARLYSHVKVAKPIHPGVVDPGMRVIVPLNRSDREAIHHYTSYLIRKIAGCDRNASLRTAASHQPLDRQTEFSVSDCKILIIDELRFFDERQLATTIGSNASLQDVGIVSNPDPVTSLGPYVLFLYSKLIRVNAASMTRLLASEAPFRPELRLVLLFCSDRLLDQILTVVQRNTPKQSAVILFSSHVPEFKTATSGWRRLSLTVGPKRKIRVMRKIGSEEKLVAELDMCHSCVQ